MMASIKKILIIIIRMQALLEIILKDFIIIVSQKFEIEITECQNRYIYVFKRNRERYKCSMD